MDLLKKLLSIDAPSGNEEEIADFIKAEITDFVDEISVDALGNLIALKRGALDASHNKIMLTSNMDESGLMATVIEESGFVRFAVIGYLQANSLLFKKVRFQNGLIGVIGCEKEACSDIKDMFIDPLGAKISVGDVAVVESSVAICNDYVAAKAVGNRVGCYILIELIKSIKECCNDLYFAFTVQETLGHRGAKTAAFAIEPDYAIHIGVTPSFDMPGEEKSSIKLGKGPAIKIKDASILAHPLIKELLINAAEKLQIAYQLDVLSKGSNDAGAIHLSRGGVPSGALSIPVRFLHSPYEICAIHDIEDAIAILKEAIWFGGTHE